jgi:tetratricopeptide (TPR) repeat protein
MSSETSKICPSEKEQVVLHVVEDGHGTILALPSEEQPKAKAEGEASAQQAETVDAGEFANTAGYSAANSQANTVVEPACAATNATDSPSLSENVAVADQGITQSAGSRDYSERFYSFPYLEEPPKRKLHFDFKQFCNYLYFGAAICCVPVILEGVRLPHVWRIYAVYVILAMVGLLALLTLLSCTYAFVRPRPSDFAITLSPVHSRLLRFLALILPIPLFLAAPAVIKSQAEYEEGRKLVEAERYQDAMGHLKLAITLNPFNERALARLAYNYNCVFDYPNAIAYADRALTLRHRDSDALADRAWGLNHLDRYGEALPAAQRATILDSNNGEAFSSLADALIGLGRYEEALDASTRHIALHNTEAYAYNQRADILDQLGRLDEAREMRERAQQL